MNFDEALKYLLDLGHETLTIKLGLKNTQLLLESLQNPHRAFRSVQIAGTNGKGSTAAFLDSICRQAGIKTGLYTSPHLESITERIKIAGDDISQEDFACYATEVRKVATRLVGDGGLSALPTFFEQVTAIALLAFRKAGVELAILETGLGGRLDATTAVGAEVCAITQIAIDHEQYLGSNIESIAGEKAAIIHAGSVAVVAPQRPEAAAVILKRSKEVAATVIFGGCQSTVTAVSSDGRASVSFQTAASRYENVGLGLRGRHQIENAGLAIQLAEVLRDKGFDISHSAIVEGLPQASHRGRLELITNRPTVLLDGAHNVAGAQALREYLLEFGKRPLTIVFGAMRDKRLDEIANILFPLADGLVLTKIKSPRSASTESLESIAKRFYVERLKAEVTSSEAVETAIAQTDLEGMVCITGSLYLIGEVLNQIPNRAVL